MLHGPEGVVQVGGVGDGQTADGAAADKGGGNAMGGLLAVGGVAGRQGNTGLEAGNDPIGNRGGEGGAEQGVGGRIGGRPGDDDVDGGMEEIESPEKGRKIDKILGVGPGE